MVFPDWPLESCSTTFNTLKMFSVLIIDAFKLPEEQSKSAQKQHKAWSLIVSKHRQQNIICSCDNKGRQSFSYLHTNLTFHIS